jgi:poly(3-hydroxybutyrate) depolymerase
MHDPKGSTPREPASGRVSDEKGNRGKPVLYQMFEIGQAAFKPSRAAADACRVMLSNPFNPMAHTVVGRNTLAACEVFERTTRRYDRPKFRLSETTVDGKTVGVTEQVVWSRPFCDLVHFERDVSDAEREASPRILIVAPMSGHYATLLRGTVEAFLPTHEVFITNWQDARQVPKSAGAFDLDDYIDTISDIFRHFGGDVHVFAVCQPSVPVLAAVALMEAANDPSVPLSVTMAGGPIDTRRNPTAVNKLAMEKGTEWFRNTVLAKVPWPNPGYGRAVYPGFLQLSGFMTMNLDRHVSAHKDLFLNLVRGDGDSAERHREFYDEYLAVMDLTAEFYMQTIETVFVDHHLARGVMTHRNRAVDLSAIKRVALMTIEGEKDDITGIGQCSAALDLCPNVPSANKAHYECPKVGHYGVFNGSRFRSEIVPRISRFQARFDKRVVAGSHLRSQVPVTVNELANDRSSGRDDGSYFGEDMRAAHETSPDVGRDTAPVATVYSTTTATTTTTTASGVMSAWVGASAFPIRAWSMATRALLDTWSRPVDTAHGVKQEA